MKYIIPVVAIFFCITACNSSKKVTIQPTAETPSRLLPPLPSSIINIPFKINMKPLLAMMDSGTAKEFTNDKWPNYTPSGCDFRYKFRFVRSPFTFSVVNNKVSIGFRGNYRVRVYDAENFIFIPVKAQPCRGPGAFYPRASVG